MKVHPGKIRGLFLPGAMTGCFRCDAHTRLCAVVSLEKALNTDFAKGYAD